jgi:hypothetical protein
MAGDCILLSVLAHTPDLFCGKSCDVCGNPAFMAVSLLAEFPARGFPRPELSGVCTIYNVLQPFGAS